MNKRIRGKAFEKTAAAFFIIASLLFASCSVNDMIVDAVSGVLGGEGASELLLGDEDPELVGDALPFMLKMYEALLAMNPENPDVLFTLGSGFVSYANMFVQVPAEMLPVEQFDEQRYQLARAKKLYLRGRNYTLQGLDLLYPGFSSLLAGGEYEKAVDMLTQDDIAAAYWAAAGWLSALSLDFFDYELTITSSQACAVLIRALELDDSYGDGALHEVFMSLYSAIPENMMYRTPDPDKPDIIRQRLDAYYAGKITDPQNFEQRARYHYEQAVALGGDVKISAYVSWAASHAVQNQDPEEFTSLLEKALEMDVNASIENRLANTVLQRKARWLLDNMEDFILF